MSPALQRADVVIVGGAVMGSAVASFLARDPDFWGSVLVIERDPTYATASTTLSVASVRQQFSTPVNIQMSQFAVQVLKHPNLWFPLLDPVPEASRDLAHPVRVDAHAHVLHRREDAGERELDLVVQALEAALPHALA